MPLECTEQSGPVYCAEGWSPNGCAVVPHDTPGIHLGPDRLAVAPEPRPSKGLADSVTPPEGLLLTWDLGRPLLVPGLLWTKTHVRSVSRTPRSLRLDARWSWKCHKGAGGPWLFHLPELLACFEQWLEGDPRDRTFGGSCGLR